GLRPQLDRFFEVVKGEVGTAFDRPFQRAEDHFGRKDPLLDEVGNVVGKCEFLRPTAEEPGAETLAQRDPAIDDLPPGRGRQQERRKGGCGKPMATVHQKSPLDSAVWDGNIATQYGRNLGGQSVAETGGSLKIDWPLRGSERGPRACTEHS